MEKKHRDRATKWSLGIGSGISTLFISLAEPEAAKAILDTAWHAWLTQCLIVIAVVWFTMGKKVKTGVQVMVESALHDFKEHFDRMEGAVNKVAANLTELKETVSKDLSSHSQQLGQHDRRIQLLEQKTTVRSQDVRG